MKFCITLEEVKVALREHFNIDNNIQIVIEGLTPVNKEYVDIMNVLCPIINEFMDMTGKVKLDQKIPAIQAYRRTMLSFGYNVGLSQAKLEIENWNQTLTQFKNGTWRVNPI